MTTNYNGVVLDLTALANKVNNLPVGLDRRIDAVEAMMEAANAKIIRTTHVTSDDPDDEAAYEDCFSYEPVEVIDPRTYAEETDVDTMLFGSESDVAVQLSWVHGVGSTVIATEVTVSGCLVTRLYNIAIDTESDDYNGRRVREAAEAIRAHDALSAACLGFSLETYRDYRDEFVPQIGRRALVTTTFSADIHRKHYRNDKFGEPLSESFDKNVPSERIAYLSCVAPDCDGDVVDCEGAFEGVTDVYRRYSMHDSMAPGVDGMTVPWYVQVRTITAVSPTVAAVTGSSVIIDNVVNTIIFNTDETYDVDASLPDPAEADDEPEPPIYDFDEDDENVPLHNTTRTYADYIGARAY